MFQALRKLLIQKGERVLLRRRLAWDQGRETRLRTTGEKLVHLKCPFPSSARVLCLCQRFSESAASRRVGQQMPQAASGSVEEQRLRAQKGLT
ncbi:hypothetical protein MATL_G00091460 [Megalops atlanticus]|uniref:Uncharacterized protein n=1 Tax=Megalops atlanticus TaxID=7932 RepID=A0A9D3Q889_MEGAT|nr:hypothetical protein MATL_G00091460 [Megalops atlanticus]